MWLFEHSFFAQYLFYLELQCPAVDGVLVFEHDNVHAAALIFCGIGLETSVVASVVYLHLTAGGLVDKPAVAVPCVVAVLIAASLAASDKGVGSVGLAL